MHPALCERLVRQQMEEALKEEGLFSERVELVEPGYPIFYIRFLNRHGNVRLLRFTCDNYDFQPVAVEPVEPGTREPLPAMAWMKRNGGDFPSHHMRETPFLCLAGTRDYYTHEGHRPQVTGERWERWRADVRLADLIRIIRNKFAKGEWE